MSVGEFADNLHLLVTHLGLHQFVVALQNDHSLCRIERDILGLTVAVALIYLDSLAVHTSLFELLAQFETNLTGLEGGHRLDYIVVTVLGHLNGRFRSFRQIAKEKANTWQKD